MRSVRFTMEAAGPVDRTEVVAERGLRAALVELLEAHTRAPAYALISDHNVAPLYGEPLRGALEAAGHAATLHTFPAGEASKTLGTWSGLVESLARSGLERDGCVVSVGGGVTGDLAGFVAASYLRGVRLVQVPTSLLAMIDAAIGGKTGVDLEAGKNLAGAFHHPAAVLIDPETLETLPDDELRAGVAEAVKHGAIADEAHFDELTGSADEILARDPDAVDRLVAISVRIKTGVVARDARESGERAVLNFGHTVAHGIERATEYAVAHGRAVAMGMVAEARIGEELGVTRTGTAGRIEAALRAFGLPVRIPTDVGADAILDAAGTDKKNRAGRVRYVLLDSIGRVARSEAAGWTHAVPGELAGAVLDGLRHE